MWQSRPPPWPARVPRRRPSRPRPCSSSCPRHTSSLIGAPILSGLSSPGTGRLEFNTFEVRRLRAGVNGQWRGVQFELTFDPQDLDGTLVKDAYAEFRPGSYEIRFGQFKPPGSRDYGTSARQTDFLERAALGRALSAQRDVGVALHGDLGQRFDYDVGLFAGDNNGSTRRSGVTGAGRLEWEPGPDLVLAVYGSEGRLAAVDTDPENGLEGRLSSGYRFFENVYVQGRRTRLGGDVEWSPGRWQFTVETLRVRDERQEQGVDIDDLPSVVGIGASLTTRWRFAPRRDVAVRYEYLGFDDVGPDTDMASVRPRAADLRARAAQAVTFGGSWGVTRWVRLMGNAGVEWFSDPRTAPEAGRERRLLDARHASAGRTSRHPGIARPVSANAVTALSRAYGSRPPAGLRYRSDRADRSAVPSTARRSQVFARNRRPGATAGASASGLLPAARG